jgi:hypothetical protein
MNRAVPTRASIQLRRDAVKDLDRPGTKRLGIPSDP